MSVRFEANDAGVERIVEQLRRYAKPCLLMSSTSSVAGSDRSPAACRQVVATLAIAAGKTVALARVPRRLFDSDDLAVLNLDAPNSREFLNLRGIDPDELWQSQFKDGSDDRERR